MTVPEQPHHPENSAPYASVSAHSGRWCQQLGHQAKSWMLDIRPSHAAFILELERNAHPKSSPILCPSTKRRRPRGNCTRGRTALI